MDYRGRPQGSYGNSRRLRGHRGNRAKKREDKLRRQLERFEANRSPSNLRQVRERLAVHKLYGVTH